MLYDYTDFIGIPRELGHFCFFNFIQLPVGLTVISIVHPSCPVVRLSYPVWDIYTFLCLHHTDSLCFPMKSVYFQFLRLLDWLVVLKSYDFPGNLYVYADCVRFPREFEGFHHAAQTALFKDTNFSTCMMCVCMIDVDGDMG